MHVLLLEFAPSAGAFTVGPRAQTSHRRQGGPIPTRFYFKKDALGKYVDSFRQTIKHSGILRQRLGNEWQTDSQTHNCSDPWARFEHVVKFIGSRLVWVF